MKPQTILKNNLGISMVEVMMAVAISGGMALTIAKLMDNSNQNIKQIEAKSEKLALENVITSNFTTPSACFNTFNPIINPANIATLSGSTSASITVPSIKDRGNNILYDTNSTNIRPLTITDMKLTNYSSTNKTGDLVVSLTFRRSSTIVQNVKPMNIKINFNLNGANALVACSPMEAGGGEWMLAGNAGTVDGTDFIGTTDNVPLSFRVNSQKSGRIDSIGQIFMGYQAGSSLTTGLQNTSFGFQSMLSNTTGSYNTAIGRHSLMSNTTGQVNTAIGTNSLKYNTTGNHNIALGNEVLYYNTTGIGNVGIGNSTLDANTTGNNNYAMGFAALSNLTTGSDNIAIGNNTGGGVRIGARNVAVGNMALSRGEGSENTALGENTLINNSTGSYNSAVGKDAGSYNSNGSYNVFIGYQAGARYTQSTGSRNIFIGANAGNQTPGVYTASNKLYIETGASNTTPLIGGDFSARTINLAGTTTFDVGAWGISMKVPSTSAIRTTTASASDKIYFDSRTLFRDGASGGNGFVGIAGGLGVGSGSWWDGTVVPAQGNAMFEGSVSIGTQTLTNAKLSVEGEGTGSNTAIRAIATPSGGGGQAIYGNITPVSDDSTYIGTYGVCRNTAGSVSSYCIGVQGHAQYNVSQSMGRTYGVRGIGANGTSGWNYGVYGGINTNHTTNVGAGIYGTGDALNTDIDMSGYSSSTFAGFFKGRVYVTGPLTAQSYANNSDRRLKKDIRPLKNSLEKITKINGVSYFWKNDPQAGEQGKQQVGLIAQEVEKEYPQVVITTKNGKGIETKSLLYGQLVAPVIEAIKELYAKFLNLTKSDENQNQMIQIQAESIRELKDENQRLRQQMKLQQESFNERLKKIEARMNKN